MKWFMVTMAVCTALLIASIVCKWMMLQPLADTLLGFGMGAFVMSIMILVKEV